MICILLKIFYEFVIVFPSVVIMEVSMTPNRVVYDFLMHITLPVSFVYLYNRERAKQTPQIPASDPPHPINEEKKGAF